MLAVVVYDARGVLDATQRQAELDAALALLAEVADTAPSPQQALLQRLNASLRERLPQLLTFVAHVDQVQRDLCAVLPPDRQAVLAWAWRHRRTLRWSSADILAAIPCDWHPAARVLLATWDDAVHVSSAVERYHAIMRPHLAVHRTLNTGMLALLAVWHNHRVFTCGIHKGKKPLHLSGLPAAPTDWLTALGYPPILQTSIAGLRQMVETVHEKLLPTFRLDRERPHDLPGLRARMARRGCAPYHLYVDQSAPRT